MKTITRLLLSGTSAFALCGALSGTASAQATDTPAADAALPSDAQEGVRD